MADNSSQEQGPKLTEAASQTKTASPSSQEPRLGLLQKLLLRVKGKDQDQKPQNAPEPTGLLGQKSTRRAFLRKAGLGAAGLAAAAIVGTDQKDDGNSKPPLQKPSHENTSNMAPVPNGHTSNDNNNPPPQETSASPGSNSGDETNPGANVEMPKDTLSVEQLADANIRIIRSPQTELFLRPNALKDFKVLRDAAAGKINEVVIVLSDNSVMNWNASESMPEEARDVYQAMHYKPGELESQIHYEQIKSLQINIEHWTEVLKDNGPFYQNSPGSDWPDMSDFNKVRDFIKKQQEKINQLIAEGPPVLSAEEVIRRKETDDACTAKIRHTYNAIVSQTEYMDPKSERLKRMKRVLQKYPKMNNKVFIFMAVGPGVEPDPSQSRPDTDVLGTYNPPAGGYIWGEGNRFWAGFTLRHEFLHWKKLEAQYANFYDETKADALAFASEYEASNSLQEKGDDSHFSLVFRNKKGITITANQKAARDKNL